jgi:hypothetical protein
MAHAALFQAVEAAGQGHVLAHWAELSQQEQAAFAADLATIDFPAMDQQFKAAMAGADHRSGRTRRTKAPPRALTPPVMPHPRRPGRQAGRPHVAHAARDDRQSHRLPGNRRDEGEARPGRQPLVPPASP